MEHSNDLSILFQFENRLQGVPSWVPDFRSPVIRGILVTDNRQRLVSFTPDGGKMILTGCEICVCEDIVPQNPDEVPLLDISLAAKIQLLNELLLKLPKAHNLSLNKVLKSWIRCNQVKYGITEEDAFAGYHSVLRNDFVDSANTLSIILLKQTFCYYCIIATTNGDLGTLRRYDCDAEPGDIIIASRAAPVLILLRPTNKDGEYKWLGACKFEAFRFGESLFDDRIFKDFVIV